MALLLIHCGGETSANPVPAPAAAATTGGAGGADDDCGGAPAGACDGGASEHTDPTTGVHTACRLNVKVNRRGKSVCLDFHIH